MYHTKQPTITKVGDIEFVRCCDKEQCIQIIKKTQHNLKPNSPSSLIFFPKQNDFSGAIVFNNSSDFKVFAIKSHTITELLGLLNKYNKRKDESKKPKNKSIQSLETLKKDLKVAESGKKQIIKQIKCAIKENRFGKIGNNSDSSNLRNFFEKNLKVRLNFCNQKRDDLEGKKKDAAMLNNYITELEKQILAQKNEFTTKKTEMEKNILTLNRKWLLEGDTLDKKSKQQKQNKKQQNENAQSIIKLKDKLNNLIPDQKLLKYLASCSVGSFTGRDVLKKTYLMYLAQKGHLVEGEKAKEPNGQQLDRWKKECEVKHKRNLQKQQEVKNKIEIIAQQQQGLLKKIKEVDDKIKQLTGRVEKLYKETQEARSKYKLLCEKWEKYISNKVEEKKERLERVKKLNLSKVIAEHKTAKDDYESMVKTAEKFSEAQQNVESLQEKIQGIKGNITESKQNLIKSFNKRKQQYLDKLTKKQQKNNKTIEQLTGICQKYITICNKKRTAQNIKDDDQTAILENVENYLAKQQLDDLFKQEKKGSIREYTALVVTNIKLKTTTDNPVKYLFAHFLQKILENESYDSKKKIKLTKCLLENEDIMQELSKHRRGNKFCRFIRDLWRALCSLFDLNNEKSPLFGGEKHRFFGGSKWRDAGAWEEFINDHRMQKKPNSVRFFYGADNNAKDAATQICSNAV